MEKAKVWPAIRLMVEIIGWIFLLLVAGCVGMAVLI